MRRLEFAARVVLVYTAGILGAVNADVELTAPFAIASLFLTAELATRRSKRITGNDGVDQIARIGGSIISALIIGGLLLNFTSQGLTRQTWSALLVLVSLIVLWWRRNEQSSYTWLKIKFSGQLVWLVATVAVLAGAVAISIDGANDELKSPLQMWVQGKSQGSITVAISSGSSGGPYRIVMDPEVTKTNAFDPFSLSPGNSVEVGLPAGPNTRYNIYLEDARTGEKLRSVIVDSPPLS